MTIHPSQPSAASAGRTADDAGRTRRVDLAAVIRALVDTAEAAGLSVRPTGSVEASAHRPAQLALLRLLRGSMTPGDEQLLAMPTSGSRLVVVRHASGFAARHLAALDGDRSVLAVHVDPGCTAGLVRNIPRRAGQDRALTAARRVAVSTVRLDPDASVGISAALRDSVDLPDALRDADDAATLAVGDRQRVGCVDDLWARITLHRLHRQLAGCLTAGNPLARLAAHDDQACSELLRSVAVWLRTNQDTRASAAELSVHPNTLRYRLRRAGELAGVDLTDPIQRLVTEVVTTAGPRC